MQFDLTAAIQALQGANAPFTLANGAIPGPAYLLSQFLPELPSFEYDAKSSNMTIRATMATLVGMDSPYPAGGAIETSAFAEKTYKIANNVELPEVLLRQLQAMLIRVIATGGSGIQESVNTALNFLNKIIIQPHLDRAEWLRGLALSTGAISWTANEIVMAVDYGVPAGNFLTARTGADGYGGSTSKFWTDIRAARSKLGGQVAAFLMHQDTKEMILANDANNIKILSENPNDGTFTIVRYKSIAGTTVESTDARDRAAFITYSREADLLDPANPSRTKAVKLFPTGVITAIGTYNANRFVVGQGGTQPPANPSAPQIGYTHLAPTVEGGGSPGRWAELFQDPNRPWTFGGRAVTNLLPVIDAPERIVLLTTEMV